MHGKGNPKGVMCIANRKTGGGSEERLKRGQNEREIEEDKVMCVVNRKIERGIEERFKRGEKGRRGIEENRQLWEEHKVRRGGARGNQTKD